MYNEIEIMSTFRIRLRNTFIIHETCSPYTEKRVRVCSNFFFKAICRMPFYDALKSFESGLFSVRKMVFRLTVLRIHTKEKELLSMNTMSKNPNAYHSI